MYLITGASGGIGKLLFERFTDGGKLCFGTYHSARKYEDPNLSKVDVRDFDEVSSWVSGLLKNTEDMEVVLINCAGISYNAFGHKSDMAEWRNVIDVNLIGTFNVIRAVLPYMRECNYGRIINFASVVGQRGVPGTSSYAASKTALWGMTKALAVENAGKNITINNINLGYFDIGIIEQVPSNNKEALIASIPVGRFGDPINIVRTVEFIVKNSDLCGVSLDVSGGLV
jgi:NAD(P)-dependent dehydrogenase (short-subunit alcohol dehydrogenase family)